MQSASLNKQTYRPDIDGLRAIAVLLVVLFHCDILFSGGFVGVDIFFVISGFLITGIITRDQARKEFSFASFWTRRVRRILPASMSMCAASLLAGFVILFPSDYRDLAESAIAQQAIVSNVYFWRTTGYFSEPANIKPLLHTWSLAVEEQFYLAFPFILMSLNWINRTKVRVLLLALIALSSLALSEWLIAHRPSAAFYLLPSRAWELLVGSLIALAPAIPSRARVLSELLALIGVSLIAWASLMFTAETSFPGLNALLPCAGAAALIVANSNRNTRIGAILSWRPIVAVGLISYSLYLWHWPLLAFARYWLGEHLDLITIIEIVLLTFLVSYLSWCFIEVPFRYPSTKIKNANMRSIFIASSGLFLVSVVIVCAQGVPWRVSGQAVRFRSASEKKSFRHELKLFDIEEGNLPRFGSMSSQRRCVIWGDSHAMSLVAGLDEACKALDIAGIQITCSETPPLLDFERKSKYGLNEDAPAFSREVVTLVSEAHVDCVVLAAVWKSYAADSRFESALIRTVAALKKTGARIAIVLDVPFYDENIPMALARHAFFGSDIEERGMSMEDYEKQNRLCNAFIKSLKSHDVSVLSPAEFMCSPDGRWLIAAEGEALYFDNHHLSQSGGLRLAPMFRQFLLLLYGQDDAR